MNYYKSKYSLISGSDIAEVIKNARKEYTKIQHLTRRQPYIRSVYFSKDKIFLSVFWHHLAQKHRAEKFVRAQLFLVAVDLMRKTTIEPETRITNGVLLHRFMGESKEGIRYYVQVKQEKKSGRKDFMSAFPVK